MKKWAFILFLALLSASCSSLLSDKPIGTLSEEQMTGLLVDIHLTEATLRLANDSLAKLSDSTDLRIRFAQVFKKHNVTPDEFNRSLNYYMEHIDGLVKIYDDVINNLMVLEASLIPKAERSKEQRGRIASDQEKMTNPWFRSLNKNVRLEEFHYFDSVKYPVTPDFNVYFPDSAK